MDQTGCKVLRDLWNVALECKVQDPSIYGEPARKAAYIQCANIRDFMVMASLKCWEERGSQGPPPTVVVQDNYTQTSYESASDAQRQQRH